MGVPEPVHGDDRDAQIPAVAGQNAVHRRVVDLPVHEDGLVLGQILQGLGELGDDLPVDLDLPHGGLVLRRHEAVLALVVVGFVDRERLVGEVEVLGGHRQRLGEAHPRLGDQQDQPIRVDPRLQVEAHQQGVELVLVQELLLLRPRLLPLDDRLAGRVVLDLAVVDGVQDGGLQLVVEAHRGLPLMILGVGVQELLIGRPVELCGLQRRDEPLDPGRREAVLVHRRFADGPVLVDLDPIVVIDPK